MFNNIKIYYYSIINYRRRKECKGSNAHGGARAKSRAGLWTCLLCKTAYTDKDAEAMEKYYRSDIYLSSIKERNTNGKN